MALLIFIILAFAACIAFYSTFISRHDSPTKSSSQERQPTHFDQLDENGDPIKEETPISSISQPKVKVVIGGGDSDAPVQELKYFCIKDKGYHVTVWPKDHSQFDIVEFNIAGMSHRDGINDHLGEFVGILQPEPTNPYDHNAIKVLTPDGHHVGYVPKDLTAEIRQESTLPCSCLCYIGENDGTYFSDCYILRKNQ